MYHTIWVNYKAEIEDGAGAGTGVGPQRRLRLQPNTPSPGGSGSKTLDYRTAVLRKSHLGTKITKTKSYLQE